MRYLTAILTQIGRNLAKTWITQLLTLLSVSIAILIFVFFSLLYLNLQRAGGYLGEELRLIVYLEKEMAPALRQQLEEKITAYGNVHKIVHVSQQEAYARLAGQLGEERDVLTGLDHSFLPPSLEIYPQPKMGSLARVRQFAGYLSTLPGVEKVQYGQDWLERFASFTRLVKIVVLGSGSLLILTTMFLISHSIKLTLVARREELEVLRLLGADQAYVRGPLLVEGFLLGLLSTGLGLSGLYLFFRWIKGHFPGADLPGGFELTFFPLPVLGLILLAGVLLCTAGSMISTRKFLRV